MESSAVRSDDPAPFLPNLWDPSETAHPDSGGSDVRTAAAAAGPSPPLGTIRENDVVVGVREIFVVVEVLVIFVVAGVWEIVVEEARGIVVLSAVVLETVAAETRGNDGVEKVKAVAESCRPACAAGASPATRWTATG